MLTLAMKSMNQSTNVMNQQIYRLLLLLIICLSIPSGAAAQYTISKILGDGQTGRPGQTLKPFVVEVRDPSDNNNLAAGVFVTFLHDRGSLTGVPVLTDTNGRATSTLTLGRGTGVTMVTASVRGGASVTFTARAIIPTPPKAPPEPTKLFIVSGDNQTGIIGETLADPFVVRVRDQYNKPLEGATVTFTVLTGGGSLSTTTTITDISGRAKSTLTLGNGPGTNTVEVRAEGVSQTRIFSAEATLPPPVPTTLSTVSDDNQTGLTGETLMDPFVVELHDQYGDPVEGVMVTFTLLGGDGALSTETTTTDANGQAETTLTLGNEPGEYTLGVSVEGIAQTVTFNVIAELLQFDLSLPAGLNLVHLPLKVRAVDGMPAGVESVADLYDALGGADTLNWLITHDPETQTWYGYFGDADRGSIADKMLTDEAGILADIKTPISVRLGGDALGMDGTQHHHLKPRAQPRGSAAAGFKNHACEPSVRARRGRRGHRCNRRYG